MKPLFYNNLEQKQDGTLVAYISFWRYLFFGILFAFAFYSCVNAVIRLYFELPPGFWRNWDKTATVTLIFLIVAICIPFFTYRFLKSGYKKVHFELTSNSVRYIKTGIRGGILLSDQYITVPLKDIQEVKLRSNPLGGGVITAIEAGQTHSMILLLNSQEQLKCYGELEKRIQQLGVISK